jgi:hypothetical protein
MAFRPATVTEYIAWLRPWLAAGNQPTHYYDYPWARWTWLTAEKDFTTGGECGANAVHIIVRPGVRHAGGGIGHNQLYFLDGTKQVGGQIPIFTDADFTDLPGVVGFVANERRRDAEYRMQIEESRNERAAAAVGSDVTRYLTPAAAPSDPGRGE